MSVTKVTGMMQTSTKGGDIPSASPCVIDTDGDYFDVTGTTNFAAFTVVAGRRFTVQFDGILIMSHHATNLDLPGGASITTAVGDVAEFFATGADTVQCVNYTKADGTAVVVEAGVVASMQTNLALNFFLDAIDHARSIQNLQDGWVDQFEDQTGVDDTNCVGETYDSSNDLYSNLAAGVTKITNATAFGDFASVSIPFDGVTTGTNSAAGTLKPGSAGGPAYAGQDWGISVTKLVAEARIYPASDQGFINGGFSSGHGITITLEGSNTGPTSGYTQLGTSATNFANRTSTAEVVTYSGSTLYRWHRVKLLNNIASNPLIVEAEFYQAAAVADMTLIAEPVVALSVPSDAHVTILKQDVDAITLNTDLIAWVSRSKQAVTSDFGTDEKLDASSHGISDDDRVMFTSSGADLPAGLDSETVYHVVNKSTSDFEVSTSQGGSAVNITDNGTGTHYVHVVTLVTLTDEGTYSSYDIIEGSVDISAQPSDTDMALFVQVLNTKTMKIHGQALQWS